MEVQRRKLPVPPRNDGEKDFAGDSVGRKASKYGVRKHDML